MKSQVARTDFSNTRASATICSSTWRACSWKDHAENAAKHTSATAVITTT